MSSGRVVETRETKEGKTIRVHVEKPWPGNSYEDYWFPDPVGLFDLDDIVEIKLIKET
jgi:hypothetical protein